MDFRTWVTQGEGTMLERQRGGAEEVRDDSKVDEVVGGGGYEGREDVKKSGNQRGRKVEKFRGEKRKDDRGFMGWREEPV